MTFDRQLTIPQSCSLTFLSRSLHCNYVCTISVYELSCITKRQVRFMIHSNNNIYHVLCIWRTQNDCNQALLEAKLQTLEERRVDLCVSLVKNILHPSHKLHNLPLKTLKKIEQRYTRATGQGIYNSLQ